MMELLIFGIVVMLFIWLGTTVDITPLLMGIVWTIFIIGWIETVVGNNDNGFPMLVLTAPILLIRLLYLRHKRNKQQTQHGGA